MHRYAAFCCCLATLLLVGPIAAQQAQDVQRGRDPDALIVLQRAVSVMGGVAISQVRDCVASGVIEAAPKSWLTSGSFVWKDSGAEFRYENPSSSGRTTLVSGRGRPAVLRADSFKRYNAHVSEAKIPPHLAALVLYKALSDERYKVAFLGEEVLNGTRVLRIQTSLDKDEVSAGTTVQEWLLDAASGLPLRVEYRLPSNQNALEYLPAAFEFSNFQYVSGVAVPARIAFYHGGQYSGVAVLTSVVFNVGISSSEFDAPAGGAR
jgi:hypothetical protein